MSYSHVLDQKQHFYAIKKFWTWWECILPHKISSPRSTWTAKGLKHISTWIFWLVFRCILVAKKKNLTGFFDRPDQFPSLIWGREDLFFCRSPPIFSVANRSYLRTWRPFLLFTYIFGEKQVIWGREDLFLNPAQEGLCLPTRGPPAKKVAHPCVKPTSIAMYKSIKRGWWTIDMGV